MERLEEPSLTERDPNEDPKYFIPPGNREHCSLSGHMVMRNNERCVTPSWNRVASKHNILEGHGAASCCQQLTEIRDAEPAIAGNFHLFRSVGGSYSVNM